MSKHGMKTCPVNAGAPIHRTLSRLILAIAILGVLGCPRPTPRDSGTEPPKRAAVLKVLVIDNQELGEAARRRWHAEGLGDLALTHQTSAEFIDKQFAIPPDFDAVIYPERLQADLLLRQMLLEIPDSTWYSEQVNKNDILSHYRGSLLRQGDRYFALPLSGIPLVMMYRPDVLAAIGASPPTTWEEFESLAERLSRAELPHDDSGQALPRAVALPFSDHWAAHILLARAAASVRSSGKLSVLFQVETMAPLIDSVPFVESLAWLKRMAQYQHAPDEQMTPRDVSFAMASGQAALAIGWPAGLDAESESLTRVAPFRIARVPGSPRKFDAARGAWIERHAEESRHVDYLGVETLVVSVLRNSLHAGDSLDFAAWLCSKRTSQQVSVKAQPNGPFRASQLSDLMHWAGEWMPPAAADDYGRVIAEAHESKLIMTFPRIVKQNDYLQSLADGVRAVIYGDAAPEESLRQVAQRWRELTELIGPRIQRDFLRRGEGF